MKESDWILGFVFIFLISVPIYFAYKSSEYDASCHSKGGVVLKTTSGYMCAKVMEVIQ